MTSTRGGSAKCSRTGRQPLISKGGAASARAGRGRLTVALALKPRETPGLRCAPPARCAGRSNAPAPAQPGAGDRRSNDSRPAALSGRSLLTDPKPSWLQLRPLRILPAARRQSAVSHGIGQRRRTPNPHPVRLDHRDAGGRHDNPHLGRYMVGDLTCRSSTAKDQATASSTSGCSGGQESNRRLV
jgi:hypothetical protein